MMRELIEQKISEYFSRPYRLSSRDEQLAKTCIHQTLEILLNTAENVKSMAMAKHEFDFKFNIGTLGEPGKPATAHKNKSGYDAGIEIAFIHMMFNKVQHITVVPERSYTSTALVVLASLTALGHEFAHAIEGHFAQAATVIVGKVDPLEELEADRRGGEGSLAALLNKKNRELLFEYAGVESYRDIIEAAFVGHWLLASTLSEYDRDSLRYAPAHQRAAMFNIGLVNAATVINAFDPLSLSEIFEESRRIASIISSELFGSSLQEDGVQGLEDGVDAFDSDTVQKIILRSAETSAASPFK